MFLLGRRRVRIGRRVVKGRFIIILLIVAACLIWVCIPKGAGGHGKVVPASSGSVDMEAAGQSVCVWPEEVYTAPEGQRVEYHVADGAQVAADDLIAEIFPPEEDSGVLDQLYALQEEITAYQISIIAEDKEAELSSLTGQVDESADALQQAAMARDVSAVADYETQLNERMAARQAWLDEQVDPDEHLMGLYDQEVRLTQSLQDKMIRIIAPAEGYVSFALDGLEGRIVPDLIDYLTPADVEGWLNPAEQATPPVQTGDQPFFKIIFDGQWYIAVKLDSIAGLCPEDTVAVRWNDGSADDTAVVVRTAEGEDGGIVILKPEGSRIHSRFGYVRITKTATGVMVPLSAVYRDNGRDYIRIEYGDGAKPTAVEVKVEAVDGENAVVSAVGDVAGLSPGVNVFTQ